MILEVPRSKFQQSRTQELHELLDVGRGVDDEPLLSSRQEAFVCCTEDRQADAPSRNATTYARKQARPCSATEYARVISLLSHTHHAALDRSSWMQVSTRSWAASQAGAEPVSETTSPECTPSRCYFASHPPFISFQPRHTKSQPAGLPAQTRRLVRFGILPLCPVLPGE